MNKKLLFLMFLFLVFISCTSDRSFQVNTQNNLDKNQDRNVSQPVVPGDQAAIVQEDHFIHLLIIHPK